MTNDHKYQPPRWAIRFLHLYCPDILLEEIEGDLYENFYRNLEERGQKKAKFRYVVDAIRFCNFTTFRKAQRLTSDQIYPKRQSNLIPMFRN